MGLSAYWSYCDELPAALAEQGGHVVVPEAGAGGQGHGYYCCAVTKR